MSEIHTDDDGRLAQAWHLHRQRLLGIAFRMLLDLGEAEDVVQEAYGRFASTGDIEDPEGWLVVVTGRLCLDRLRARRRRPAEPRASLDDAPSLRAPDPSDRITLDDSVDLALHLVLERLSPAERTAFVLHDVFQYPFEEVATIVGRTSAATRQLASRARRNLRAEATAGRFAVETAEQREVTERFIAACSTGDVEALLAVLDPDVDGRADVGTPQRGATAVAPGLLRYLGPAVSPTLVALPTGSRAGIVALRDGRAYALVLLTIEHGLVAHIEAFASERVRATLDRVLGLA